MKTIKNETLEDFVERISKLTQSELSELGRTRESYLTMAMHCKEIRDTIRYDELKLLFYLRNGRRGSFTGFLMAAKQSYEAYLSLVKLFKKDSEE